MVGTVPLACMAPLVALRPLVAVQQLVAGATIILNTWAQGGEQFTLTHGTPRDTQASCMKLSEPIVFTFAI